MKPKSSRPSRKVTADRAALFIASLTLAFSAIAFVSVVASFFGVEVPPLAERICDVAIATIELYATYKRVAADKQSRAPHSYARRIRKAHR